jgi:hypothetical protein
MSRSSTRITVFGTAMTCGLLLAASAHLLAGRSGEGLRLAPFGQGGNPIAPALTWWAITAAGLFGSFIAGLMARDAADGTPRHRSLRVIVGGLFCVMLAIVPHLTVVTPGQAVTEAFAGSLGGFGLAVVTAFCGSWFAAAPARREADHE